MVLAFGTVVESRPQLKAKDLEPFLDNPAALKEFGELLAAEIRSGKPSDLVAAGLGLKNATLIDLVPGANLGKDVVAGGVQSVFEHPPLVRIVVGAATANQSEIIENGINLAADGITLAADGITLATEVAQNTTRDIGEGISQGLSFIENMFSLLFNHEPDEEKSNDVEPSSKNEPKSQRDPLIELANDTGNKLPVID